MRRDADARIGIFWQSCLHVLLPQLLAGFQVDADKMADEVFDFTRLFLREAVPRVAGHEDFPANDDRTGSTRSRQWRLPRKVGIRRPGRGQRFRIACHARARQPTKTRPVVGTRGEPHGCQGSKRQNESDLRSHSVLSDEDIQDRRIQAATEYHFEWCRKSQKRSKNATDASWLHDKKGQKVDASAAELA